MPGGNLTMGTIDSNGLYTAPNSVPNPPTVTVTSILQSDTTKTASSSVTIQALSSIQGPLSLSPVLSSVTLSQLVQLQVLTAGVTNSVVNWSVDGVPGGNATNGTITSGGVYTPGAAGSHLIIATLQVNPNAIGSAQVEVTDLPGTFTWRNDNSRSGVNSQELALAPATVSSSTFGKLFSCPLDGYAYAEPLYVANLPIPGSGIHNVVLVATEKDSVYAFDADANPCVQLWHTSLIPSGSEAIPTPNTDITSADIVPYVGITGTPVINVSSFTLYVVAKTRTIGLSPVYSQLMYALDLTTGQPKIKPNGAPIASSASVSPAFSPSLENQRAALLLDNNTVYVAFGSHGGQGNYHGWLLGLDSSTLLQTMSFDVTPDGLQGGGIWQSGGGPSADSNHYVFVLTGDGPFDANRGGVSYSNSFLRLGAAGALSVADYFSPCNEISLESSSLDVGASSALLLPDFAGSASEPHLMIGASKGGSLYLANRNNLGGYNPVCPDVSTRVQTVPVGDGPILSTPIFWNNAVYVAAGNGKLKAFPVTGGVLASSPLASQSPEMFGSQGATPVISAKGSSNAIIWLVDSSGALATPNTAAILRAFDPSNLSNEIYDSAMVTSRDTAGHAVKFTVPTIANAKVYVGTQTELDVYGLLH
ncbi:MAG: hypothetical protein LAO19_22440 [Acidobacteriia bacterium]|nr:hypothetical protein [Terriglobia bacterium]